MSKESKNITLCVVFDGDDEMDFAHPWTDSHDIYFNINGKWYKTDSGSYAFNELSHIFSVLGFTSTVLNKTNAEMEQLLGDTVPEEFYIYPVVTYPDKLIPPHASELFDKNVIYSEVAKLPTNYDDIDCDCIYILGPIPKTRRYVIGYYFSDSNRVYCSCKYDMKKHKVLDYPEAHVVDMNGKRINTYEEYRGLQKENNNGK